MDGQTATISSTAAAPATGGSNSLSAVPNTMSPAIPKLMSLRRNVSWTLLGNLVFAVCQWGILIAIARLGSAEMVGQFALAIAVTAPIMIFSNLALSAVQATDAQQNYQLGEYLAVRLLTTGLALLGIGALCVWGGYRQETALVIMIVGVMKATESISDIIYGFLRQRESFDLIAKLQMSTGIVSLIVLIGILATTGSILYSLLGWTLVSVIRLLVIEIRCARAMYGEAFRFQPLWTGSRLKKLVYLTAPLGIVTMLTSLNTNIPRYFLQHYAGEAALGVFAAIVFLTAIGTQIMGAVGNAVSPRLSRYFVEAHYHEYYQLLWKLSLFSVAIGLAGVGISLLFGPQLLTWIYSAEYAEQSRILPWVMLAAGLNYVVSILGVGMTARGSFQIQPLIGVVIVVTQTATCAWLIPACGLLGAAWSMLITASVTVGVLIFCTMVASKKSAPSVSS